MKEGYEKYCRFYGCEEKECWYNGCQCEGERLIVKEPKILSETSEETKQRVRDTANKLVMKQETIEEAAENSFLANKLENSNAVEKAHYIAGFRKGAKWQQERSYSEEEVNNLFATLKSNSIDNVVTITNVDLFINSWKKQFKKK